jgi:L-2-hydroxyglutarate oxidase
MNHADLLVVGGGIVGLATAWRFGQRFPGRKVRLLEKEPRIAAHQTGRNSGVIHSGIYYKPGSQKAELCKRGKRELEQFCRDEGVRFETCGKVVVALDESELPALERIAERARANEVAAERIGPQRLRELEPHAAGIAALHVPGTGIVDYPGVCAALAARIREQGGEIELDARLFHLERRGRSIVASTPRGEFEGGALVNCAGLQADRIARLDGLDPRARIVPFRGEYWELRPQAQPLCRNLIYPVPDPSFPFLGVHFTRLVAGGVECGPNAVLAFAREGYTRSTFDWPDLSDALSFPGFWRLARRHWRAGMGELRRSCSKSAFTRALQRLMPELVEQDLLPAPAGVRAQALTPQGTLVDDFWFERGERSVHVLNAPSPAATAALAIGSVIVERLAEALR